MKTFLKTSSAQDIHSPDVTNAAPRGRIFLAELAEQMTTFETAEKFYCLKERISSRHPETSAEGLSVLEVSKKFHSAGFSVSFEPKILVTQKYGEARAKFPDVKIKDEVTSEEVFVEVSRLLAGQAQRKGRQTFQALCNIWDCLTLKYRTKSALVILLAKA